MFGHIYFKKFHTINPTLSDADNALVAFDKLTLHTVVMVSKQQAQIETFILSKRTGVDVRCIDLTENYAVLSLVVEEDPNMNMAMRCRVVKVDETDFLLFELLNLEEKTLMAQKKYLIFESTCGEYALLCKS